LDRTPGEKSGPMIGRALRPNPLIVVLFFVTIFLSADLHQAGSISERNFGEICGRADWRPNWIW
jgi:hypothetical protein